MALYREGDVGEPVRDIQERLRALGLSCDPDPLDTFGPGTRRSVETFQHTRSIAVDGTVGSATWRMLVDAGFDPGDRLLYHKMPMFHGDDVVEIQRNLNALGFDAGIVDGIFGPNTFRAVLDFQQNRRMAEDGIVGPQFLGELGLMARATHKMGRDVVRQRVWLGSLPASLAGQRIYVDPFCRDDHEAEVAWEAAVAAGTALRRLGAQTVLSRSVDTLPPERIRARQANQLGVDLVISFSLPRTDVPGIYFFASTTSRSEAGEAMAKTLARRLGLQAVGRATPMLRETRAPAVVITLPRLDARLGLGVVRGLEVWLAAGPAQDPTSKR